MDVMIRAIAAILGLAFLGVFAPAEASLWATDCKEQNCGVSITITETGSNKKMVVFTVMTQKQAASQSLLITTPLGVALDAGARVLFGTEELPLIFKVCLVDGCRAFADLNQAQLDAMTTAGMLEVRFFAQGQSAPFSIKFSSEGLSEAIAEARKP
jgi:invasion protein IalB